jgi:hypothetical protein
MIRQVGLMAVMEFSVIYRESIRSVYTAHITGRRVGEAELSRIFKHHSPRYNRKRRKGGGGRGAPNTSSSGIGDKNGLNPGGNGINNRGGDGGINTGSGGGAHTGNGGSGGPGIVIIAFQKFNF